MPPHRTYQRSKESSTKQPCKHCRNLYLPQGIKKHETSCVKEHVNRKERDKHNKAYIRDVHRTEIAKEAIAATSSLLVHPGITRSLGSAAAVIPVPLRQLSAGPSQSIPGSPTGFALNEDDVLMGMVSPRGRNTLDSAQVAGHSVNSAVLDVRNDHHPKFKTEFHPHSKHPTLFQSAEEFGQQNLKYMALDHEPWRPFALEGNYIFATVAVEARLSSTQVDSLLKLIHCIWQGTASITLHNDAGLRTALDRAVAQLTPFSKFEIAAPYKGSDVTFPIHICPLWDWALDLLQNPSLALHFVWDAERVFKLDGETYEHFYTEPWTGDRWWDIQVPELASEERKTGYVNFKCVVWHEAFYKLLEKVAELSKVGYLHECYENIRRWLFPVILILSADYEELCVMTLIQGTKCKFPCPFCLVPLEELWDLSKTYEMHTTKQHQEALVLYEQKKSAGEKKLKSLGLRPIKNIFWLVEHSEPEQAASFEPLHSLHGSLGGKHMHEELKIVVNELGRDFETCLEEQVSAFPCWRGLAHFDTVIHITFSDGNKMRDLTRQCFYTALDILMSTTSQVGYQLLHMICSYLQLETLIGLDIHTEVTLGMIEDELLVFRGELKVFCSFDCLKDNWNFPKVHLWKHVTHDIRSKGAVRNYSARPNEKMHGLLKDAYQDRSNRKDVAGQILHIDHHRFAIKLIQARIDAENKRVTHFTDNEDNDEPFEGNTRLGAPQQPSTLSDVENTHRDDQAFEGFYQRLEIFLNTCLPTYGYPLNAWIRLQGTDTFSFVGMPEDFTDALRNVDSDSSGADSHLDHSDDNETSDLEELREWQRIMHEPPPDASAPQLRSALGATQLAYSRLHIQMKQLRIGYNSLLSTLPQSHKKAVENNLNTILDNNIIAQAKKYCFFYHFWVPKDVFPLITLPPGYDLTDPAHWSMPESKIAGFKAEPYFMLPSNLKVHATTYSNFGCVFSNAVGAERPNILKPVKDNAQQLFAHLELSANLFANENSRALCGSNEAVRVLLKMHPRNIDACYTPLSPILFPKPDAPVARDLFKTPLLVNVWYLLSSDHKLTTIGEESGFRYQDDFEYFIELLSHPSKREWSLEVMEFFNQGVWNASSNTSANAALGSSNDTSVASTWESDILAQLDGPRQPTPPPDLHFNRPNSTSISHHMPEATHGRAADLVVISQANSVSLALSVDVSNLSLGGSHTSALPSVSSRGRELPVEEVILAQGWLKFQWLHQ
ncbi:hypothetical protein BKA82DRAFT_28232 [Pisolithus tinctorius]|nr:hypothetical protein BKA82DRAFT_28232 [Pisolithus tinctorius]